MPELPEVQTVVKDLDSKLNGKTFINVVSPNAYTNVFHQLSLEKLNAFLINNTINKIWRRGKYIVFTLSKGFLCIHLRMTGKLLTSLENHKDNKYVSALFTFSDYSSLYFKDIRKFGRIYCSNNLDWLEDKLGIEPLSHKFTKKWLITQFKKKNRQAKPLLLDQTFIAGLGNIYIDESLWKAGIHPNRISSTISEKSISKLHSSIIEILSNAIQANGTTIINFSYGENGQGEYTNHLQVFGRQGFPCSNCGNIIVKEFIAQRGTHYCLICQPIYIKTK